MEEREIKTRFTVIGVLPMIVVTAIALLLAAPVAPSEGGQETVEEAQPVSRVERLLQEALAYSRAYLDAARGGDLATAIPHELAALRALDEVSATLMLGVGFHYNRLGYSDGAVGMWDACAKVYGEGGILSRVYGYEESKHFGGYEGPHAAYIAEHQARYLRQQLEQSQSNADAERACSGPQPAAPGTKEASTIKRYGMVLGVRPERFEEYKKAHRNVWPEILAMIQECNIRNYSIYHKDYVLFSYFEYVGDDFERDMAKMAADSKTQEWWAWMEPMQVPLETRQEGEWWADMEELFHMD